MKRIAFYVSIIVFLALFLKAPITYAQQCRSQAGGYCVYFAAVGDAVPGLEFLKLNVSDAPLGDLISSLYVFGLGLVGIAALIMLTYGGIRYMLAGDRDPTEAKKHMKNAVIGLVLALSSWLILFTINPDLVKKLQLRLEPIEAPPQEKAVGPLFEKSKGETFGDTVKETTERTKELEKSGSSPAEARAITDEESVARTSCELYAGDKQKLCAKGVIDIYNQYRQGFTDCIGQYVIEKKISPQDYYRCREAVVPSDELTKKIRQYKIDVVNK